MRTALPVLVLCAAATGAVPAPARTATGEAAPAITAAAIRAHMRFLADDALEGRGAATRGYDLAAAYVAAHLEAAGVAPGGKDGTYYQSVPLRRAVRRPEAAEMTLVRDGAEERLLHERDFVAFADYLRPDTLVQAPVVYVGFGVTAPEQGHDDFAGVDTRGKVILRLGGAPPSFPNTIRAHHSSTIVKARNAAAHGAVGVIDIRTPEQYARAPWERGVRQSRLPSFRWVNESGQPNDAFPEIQASVGLSEGAVAQLLKGTPYTLAELAKAAALGKTRAFALPVEVRLRTGTEHSAAHSPNVVGVLKGSDPVLAREYVVYSAHLDHLGRRDDREEGDLVHNGALDNATGIAALIEIARVFARTPPRRSVAFLAVTAEEKGLLGSNYFASHPSLDGPVVANINMDMLLAIFPARDVVVFGAEHSSLGPIAIRAARRTGFEVSPDPSPEESVFVRSDQYSFVKRGVPAVFVTLGTTSRDPRIDGPALVARWRRNVYHTPQDDLQQDIDYDTLARVAQLNLLIGRDVGDAPERPRWNAGDFFGRTFGGAAGQ